MEKMTLEDIVSLKKELVEKIKNSPTTEELVENIQTYSELENKLDNHENAI